MKTCGTCGKTYEDETMVYCLDDGSRLVVAGAARDHNATLTLPADPTIPRAAERPSPATAANQATITARPEHFQLPYAQVAAKTGTASSRKSTLPWIFAMMLVLGVSSVVIAWLVVRGKDDRAQSRSREATPAVSPRSSPAATPDASAREDESFTVLDNMTFHGTRITYYPRQSFDLCEADCLKNGDCRGFTWIRPGAYNPGDAAMCYLMSALTDRVPHACCISGVRN
jgi:hypothetical protein